MWVRMGVSGQGRGRRAAAAQAVREEWLRCAALGVGGEGWVGSGAPARGVVRHGKPGFLHC